MKPKLPALLFFLFSSAAQAQPPQLWVTCESGGASGNGAIIKSDSTGSSFHVVYSFDFTNGSFPDGTLCSGGNGKLYGITGQGGIGNNGVCFSYDTLTGIYTRLHSFNLNYDSGYYAYSGMVLANDGMLYGITYQGGLNGGSLIYRVDPSINTYSPVFRLNGEGTSGPLVLLNDGKLYATTQSGGLYGVGIIFSFDPPDSSFTYLQDFTQPTGSSPVYCTLLEATDGKLYGLTDLGGAHGVGVLFSYDRIADAYTDLHDFNNSDGAEGFGGVIQASNGLLYGMTYRGGVSDSGVIFSFDIATQNYSVLHNFSGPDGSYPQRSLMQASSGLLFGTTWAGGLSNDGTAFSFDIATNTFSKLIDFASIGCSSPSCDILETGARTTSIAPIKNTKEELIVYPNPAIDHLTVFGKILTPKSEVEILNTQGEGMTDFSLKGNTINISNLPTGFYILKFTEGNTVTLAKVMKQ